MASELTELVLVAGAVVAVILGLRALSRRRRTPMARPFWKRQRDRFRPWDQEAELLRLCRGDRELAERLIAHELERSPQLSRAGAALAAATRLRHDQG